MDKILKDIREIEFDHIDYHKESNDYFGIIKGNIPILISAPHGARHLRKDKSKELWKEEDEYTSSIAIKLGEITSAHVIYVKNKTDEDSNYLRTTKYKEKIKEIIGNHGIRFLADIHGVDLEKTYKINVGIIDENDMKECSCPDYKSVIEKSLEKFQSPLFNLGKYKAKTKGTVTYFARHECGIESAQFEIRADHRIIERKEDSSKAKKGIKADYRAEEKDVLTLMEVLEKMIKNIQKKIIQQQ